MNTLEKLKQSRLRKLEKLKEKGINPYKSFCCKKVDIIDACKKIGEKLEVVGRIFSRRGHGKLVFADLKDETGKIQLMFKFDLLGKKGFELLELLDIGDFVWAKGEVGKSLRGELSLFVEDFKIIAKALRPLPEKWHGLKDVEERYRQRYVDLLVNEEIRQVFLTRTKIVKLLRQYLDKHGFIEVETPVLQPIYGGATARPFITHHNALDIDLYLRISDELYLKRLIVGGFEKVYEIGKDFRNEGIDRAHNPEFTQLEFYWAYVDYEFLMKFTEEMLSWIVKEIKGDYKVEYQGKVYDFKPPWPRVEYCKLFEEKLGINLDEVNSEEKLLKEVKMRNLLSKDEIPVGFGNLIDKLYKKHIRPELEGPLFLIDHPVVLKPLAKRKDDDPSKAASFQLLVAGEEFINAYNELNDPIDQKNRWLEEMKLAEKGAEEYQVLDEDYIRALEYGMPPTAGWGMGIDRFTAFLTNQPTIKEVILFPTLRPEKESSI